MFKIESSYITIDRTFSSEDEALEWAVERMEQYVQDWVEEFVTLEKVGIADDPESFIDAVRDEDIDHEYIADALQDYVNQVRLNNGEYLQSIQVLKTRKAELERQLEQLTADNKESA